MRARNLLCFAVFLPACQLVLHVTELQTKGELTYVIKDIEGCYPHMPKEIIRFAMRDMVEELKRVKQYEAVEVPGKKTEKCRWKCRRKTARGRTVLPLQVLLDIMEFALDNTYIKDKNGNIFKQEVGIPMGDPHSPGMAIIVRNRTLLCADWPRLLLCASAHGLDSVVC